MMHQPVNQNRFIFGRFFFVLAFISMISLFVVSLANSQANVNATVTVSPDAEILIASAVRLGNQIVNPGQTRSPLLIIRVDNHYASSKTITGFTFRDNSIGTGSLAQRLANIDSLALYADINNDFIIGGVDSLIGVSAYDTNEITVAIAPMTLEPDSGGTFIVTIDAGMWPRDGDTLDMYLQPVNDITTGDGTTVQGLDTLNSFGYAIVDGMIADQIIVPSTGTSAIIHGDTIYNCLTFGIAKNGYQIDTLQIVNVENVGSASEYDLDGLYLYQDDGNRLWDGSATEIKLGQLDFTGALWSISGLEVPIIDTTAFFFVGGRVAEFPSDGATLSLRIPRYGIQMATGNDGPLDMTTPAIDTIVIQSVEEIAIVAAEIPGHEVIPGELTGPVFGFELLSSYSSAITIDSIRCWSLGTDPDGSQTQLDSQIDSLLMYHNLDGDQSVLGFEDTLIAFATLTNGQAVFNINALALVNGSGGIEFSVCAQLNADNGKNGNLIKIGFLSDADIFTSSPASVIGSFPIGNSTDITINAFPVSRIAIMPFPGAEYTGGHTDCLVLDLILPGNGYSSDELRSLAIRNIGYVDDAVAVSQLKLWRDNSGDGQSVDDLMLGLFNYANGVWQTADFLSSIAIAGNRFYVTADFPVNLDVGGTLQYQIEPEGAIYWSGMTGPDDNPVANPEPHVILPSNKITAIPIPATESIVSPGKHQQLMLTFALYNGYLDTDHKLQRLNLANISKTKSNADFADYEVGQIFLYLDNNGNRIMDNDSLIATGYMSDGKIQLAGLDVVLLGAESLTYFFVLSDIPLDVIDSDSLAISLESPSDLIFDQQVSINGELPITRGSYLVIDGSINQQYDIYPLASRALSPGENNIVFMAFRPAVNGDQYDTLQQLTVLNLGDADSSEVGFMELWCDVNGDGQWQLLDSLIGSLSYENGSWVSGMLDLEIFGNQPKYFILGDIMASAMPNTNIQLTIPMNGCQYVSGNSGPLDSMSVSPSEFTISTNGLGIKLASLNNSYTVGQSIDLEFSSTNLLPFLMDSVQGQIVNIDNPAIIQFDSSRGSPSALPAGDSVNFHYYYTGVQPGKISWQLRTFETTLPDSSAILVTDEINIQSISAPFSIQLTNSMPIAVTRGQINVYPLSLGIFHGSGSNNDASIRIDSLILTVQDGSGIPLQASSVLSRIALFTGSTNLITLDSISNETSITLKFLEPVIIDPDKSVQLALLVDIDDSASASEFQLGFTDIGAIQAVDRNSGQIVSLDPGTTFPIFTATCRIEDPVVKLAILDVPLTVSTANMSQENLEVLQLQLRHPGLQGSSQIQVMQLSQLFVSETSDTIVASRLIDYLSICDKHGSILGQANGIELDADSVVVDFSAPLTMSWGTIDTLHILISTKDSTDIQAFRSVIPDSSFIVARDLSSGQIVQGQTDPILATGVIFPISSGQITVMQPAQPPQLCYSDILPFDVIGGKDSLAMVDISIIYPVPATFSSIRLIDAQVTVLDSMGQSLDPTNLFDRIGYSQLGQSVSYQPFFGPQNGYTLFQFGTGGLILDPGDSLNVQLVGDIEADTPFDHFMLRIDSVNAIRTQDITDSLNQPGYILKTTCSVNFPMDFGPTGIFLPAGRPLIELLFSDIILAFAGQVDVEMLDGSLIYSSLTQQGALDLQSMAGVVRRKTADGFVSVPSRDLFNSVRLLANNTVVAIDSVLNADSVVLSLEQNYVISSGSNLGFALSCDLNEEAQIGNYIIEFADSSFLEIRDQYLNNIISPVLVGSEYPILSSEISIAGTTLENSFSNYPNPFYPSRGEITTFAYVLDEDAYVDIELFSSTGDKVKQVISGKFHASGPHQTETWAGVNGQGFDVAPGVYFCQITARYISGHKASYSRKVAVIR